MAVQHDVVWQNFAVTSSDRAKLLRQAPFVLWFTGLSGAGKTTLANLVAKRLHDLRYHAYVLDGDNLRHGLNRDLGFTVADRQENVRRMAEVASLIHDSGLIALAALHLTLCDGAGICPQPASAGQVRRSFCGCSAGVVRATGQQGFVSEGESRRNRRLYGHRLAL